MHAWTTQQFAPKLQIQPAFADIETLNTLALRGEFPITKISASHLANLPHYRLLPCGAALRRGEGPKLVARSPIPIQNLATMRVAFPGKFTAAYALYHYLLPKPRQEQFMRYDKLLGQVRRRCADAAVIIHESRFAFAQQKFVEIADLGDLWEQRTDLPVPLGIFVAREDVSADLERQVVAHLRRSLEFANAHPRSSDQFVSQWAFETSQEMCAKHIALYVTEETHTLSPEGKRAIELLAASPT